MRISPNDGQRSLRKTSRPFPVLAEWVLCQIKIDPAGEGKGHHERRRHEEVGLDVLMDARLEVAIAGKDGGGDEIELVDRFFNPRVERTGVADAGGATVADDVEAELVEIGLQPGFRQVIGDDARAGGERSLDRRIDR